MSQIYRIPPKQRLTQFTGEWCVIVKSPKMFWIVSYLKGFWYPGAIDDKLTISLTMFLSSGNIKCQFVIADKLPFLTTFQPKQSRIWKKSSSTSQKTLRLVRAKTCSPAAEGMGLTRITSLLSLSLNVLLSHQDLLKDFYLNSTHSVPSILLWPIFFFVVCFVVALKCQLADNAWRGWVLLAPWSFLLKHCLMWCKGHSTVPVSLTPSKLAVTLSNEENVCFIFAPSQGLFLYFSPLCSTTVM